MRTIHITAEDIDAPCTGGKVSTMCPAARALNRTYPEAEDTISIGYEYVLVGTDQDLGKLDTPMIVEDFANRYDSWRAGICGKPDPLSFEFPELEQWIAEHMPRP